MDYKDDLFTIEKYDEDHAFARPRSTQKFPNVPGQTVQTQGSSPEEVYIDYYKQDYEIVDTGDGYYK